MRLSRSLAVLWLALSGTTLSAQSPPRGSALTVQEIVRRAADNDHSRRERRLGMEHDQTTKTEHLNEAGQVVKTSTLRGVRREGGGLTYAASEQTAAEQNRDAADAERSLAALNLSRLALRYECRLAGTDTVRGRDCYVVDYFPRPGQPASNREEKVLNNLRGRFRIDKNTFEILQGEGSLSTPVTVALVASITRMDFNFQTQTLPNGDAGPAAFNMDLVVKAPLYYYRQRQSSQQRNWRPAAPGPAKASTPAPE